MNFTQNSLGGFRKITTYVLIISLLWQNCLWAWDGLYTLEEDLNGSRVRTYSNRRAGIVEPGTIRDNEIHNVFEDFQLLEEGGLVFTGAPNTTKIYNRIYSADPIQLSGVVEADYPLPMVFANPGGIVLENPDFQNIYDLTLAAGALAQTNKGMAYGVDEGFVTIHKTFIQEENDIKNLALAGRGIHIHQSFLSPAETIILRAGSHIKGWKGEEEWVREDYLEPDEFPLSDQPSIFLDDTTILRSKGLFFESLDEGASIYANGLLQSTEDDIVIRARGDVYLNDLFAHRNLKIKTTGKVFLGNQTFFGGSVKIKAAEIINQGNLIGTGQITFDAFRSKNEGLIKTQGLFDAKNFFNTVQGCVDAKSVANPLSLLNHNLGNVEIHDDLKLHCGTETLKGTVKTHGKIEVSGQELIIDGNICAQNGLDFKGLKQLTTKLGSTLSALGKGLQGSIATMINKGKMDFSSVNSKIGRSTNYETGIIRTRGHSILEGDHHTNKGKIFTCGVHQTTLTGTYQDSGTFYSPSLFLLKAMDIEYIAGHKSVFKDGVTRASSRFSAGEKVSFDLYGNSKACFLQLNSEDNLRYNGSIRLWCSNQFPILEYFKIFNQSPGTYGDFRKEIDLLPLGPWKEMRNSLGSGITLQARQNINCENATIDPESGSVNLIANGQVYTNNAKLKAGHLKGNHTAVKGKTTFLKNTELSSPFGNASIVAQESARLYKTTVDGCLSASVLSKNIGMHDSSLKSSHGPFVVHGEEDGSVDIKKCVFSSNSGGSFKGGDFTFHSNNAEVKNGLIEFQTNAANIKNSHVKAPSLRALIKREFLLDSSDLEATEGSAHFYVKTANINKSRIKSKLTASLMADYLTFHSSSFSSQEDNVQVDVKKSAEFNNTHLEGEKNTTLTASDLIIKKSNAIGHKGTTRVQVKHSATIEESKILAHLLAAVTGEKVSLHSSTLKSQEDSAYVAAVELGTITNSQIVARSLVAFMGKDVVAKSSTFQSEEDALRIQATNFANITNSDLLARYSIAVSGRDIFCNSNKITSHKSVAYLKATHSTNIKDSDILGKLLVSVSGEDVAVHSSALNSQKDAAQLQGTRSVKISDSEILARLVTSVMGEDVSVDSSSLTSQKDAVQVQAKHSAKITGSTILAKLLAFVGAEDVSFESSALTSEEEKARIEAKNSARISASIILARSLASVIGTDVTFHSSTLQSQEDAALIAATRLASIVHSTLKGKATIVEGGENLILSDSHLDGLENSIKADDIDATSNEINGNTLFAANNLKIHDLESSGEVVALVPNISFSGENTANSLQAQGEHIKINGALFVEKFLNVLGETIEQNGKTSSKGDSFFKATEQYIDNAESRNEAGGNLFIYAEETDGFKGYQKAGDTLEVKLKDMNLFDLLSQTQARITKAHLRETEVSFKEDFILDRTLHLWGKSLENKAKFTATKDFIAHMQTLIMNEGSMVAQGNMILESQGTLANLGLMEAANLNVKGKTVLNESVVKRNKIRGGYEDKIESEATMRARAGNLNVEATELLQARGAKFEAKLNVGLKSAGALYLGAQQLSSDYTESGKRSKYHRYTLTNDKTQIRTGQNVDIESGEGMIFEGLGVRAAGYIHAKSAGELESKTVHDIFKEQKKSESKGGVCRNKKKKETEKTSDKVACNDFEAGEDVRLESNGNNTQQATHVKSGGATNIISHQGKVIIKADKSYEMRSLQKSSKSAVWQSQQQKGRYDETVEMLEILAGGGIHISGAQGVEVEIKGGKKKSRAKDPFEDHAETAWVKGLRKDPKVTWHLIAEEHKKWNKKAQGLTGPAAAVISLAIAIATQGAGAGLIAGLTTNATVGAMSSAVFTSLVSQASISLINNQGNIGQVLKEMGSQQNLRSLATSVASAGITHGLSSKLGLPENAKGFTQHFQKNLVSSGTSAGLSMLIHDQDVKDALLQAAKGVASGTIGGLMANNIGAAYGDGELDWTMHKLAHGALGAFTGAILGDDPAAGALAGALGGMASEIIADSMKDGATEKAMERALEKAAAEGRGLSYEDVRVALSEEVRKVANIGRLGAALSAFVLNEDVNIATSTATNAVDNNFVPLLLVGLSVASVLYSGYEVYSAYEEGGAKAALVELAKQGLINLAGGAIGKLGTKAAAVTLKAVLDKNPMLAMVFSKASTQLNKVAKAAENSKIGQAACKIEEAGEKIIGKAREKLGRSINPQTTVPSQSPTSVIKTTKELKDQPWTIRPGQEYKEIIIGKAQKTGGRTLETQKGDHATRVYREAIEMAKSGKYNKVYLNRGYIAATGEKVSVNRRPDIIGIRKDGKVDVVEVQSKTDKEAILRGRNNEIIAQFPQNKRGDDIRVIKPTKIKNPHK